MPTLSPESEAAEMAETMTSDAARDVHETILEETFTAAERGVILESGRTACNDLDSLREPLDRYPTAVDLAGCPVGSSVGIWHSHVTANELRNPMHSLPDYANVMFGIVDASVIVGTESAHVLARAADGNTGLETFVDALGVDVDGPGDVARALDDGRIADHQAAQERVDEALAMLTDRVETGFPELTARIEEIGDAQIIGSAPGGCQTNSPLPIAHEVIEDDVEELEPEAVMVEAGLVEDGDEDGDVDVDEDAAPRGEVHVDFDGPAAPALRDRARRCGVAAEQTGSAFDVGGLVVGTFVGTIVGEVTTRAVFGES